MNWGDWDDFRDAIEALYALLQNQICPTTLCDAVLFIMLRMIRREYLSAAVCALFLLLLLSR